jgi:hypothetical protein
MVGDRPIGALEVGTLFARRFTDADVDLLQLAADRAALAIERVRLFERQQTIAEELQRSLLPQSLPIIPGLGWPRGTSPAARAPGWAATGTTRSRCPAGAWPWSSATSRAAASRRRR